MTVGSEHLAYGQRHYGMDHDRYDWSIMPQRKHVAWPHKARIALWVSPALEWFPLNMAGLPFKPPGAMQTAYPDLRHYTLRDYGNRVGIFRIMKALARHNIPATVAVNAAGAVRHPSLMAQCHAAGWEIMANGLDMDHLHHGGLSKEDESPRSHKKNTQSYKKLISRSLLPATSMFCLSFISIFLSLLTGFYKEFLSSNRPTGNLL
jgi:hypothetical protein